MPGAGSLRRMPVLSLLFLLCALSRASFPSWQQPFLDPLLPPYGGAKLLSNATRWTRLFFGTLQPGTGAYAMSPMLSFLNGRFLATWKLSVRFGANLLMHRQTNMP